jgi:hypothetical protein
MQLSVTSAPTKNQVPLQGGHLVDQCFSVSGSFLDYPYFQLLRGKIKMCNEKWPVCNKVLVSTLTGNMKSEGSPLWYIDTVINFLDVIRCPLFSLLSIELETGLVLMASLYEGIHGFSSLLIVYQ